MTALILIWLIVLTVVIFWQIATLWQGLESLAKVCETMIKDCEPGNTLDNEHFEKCVEELRRAKLRDFPERVYENENGIRQRNVTLANRRK